VPHQEQCHLLESLRATHAQQETFRTARALQVWQCLQGQLAGGPLPLALALALPLPLPLTCKL
jgi:hypothetical protein